MDTLDLDKLYKEGPKTKLHRMLSKDFEQLVLMHEELPRQQHQTRRKQNQELDRALIGLGSVPMTGLSQEEKLRPRISSVQTGDLNTLELGAFELSFLERLEHDGRGTQGKVRICVFLEDRFLQPTRVIQVQGCKTCVLQRQDK